MHRHLRPTSLRELTSDTLCETLPVGRCEATIAGFLSQQAHNLCAVLVENKHGHGKAEVLKVLTDAEKVSGEVVVKKEVPDIIFDLCGGFGGAILQPRTIADLGVETLAGCQSFVFLDEREQVERHLIVAAPRNVRERIIYDGRHYIHVLLEHGSRVDGKRGTGFIARQRFNGVEIKKVHNLLIFSAKLWTAWGARKDALLPCQSCVASFLRLFSCITFLLCHWRFYYILLF